MVLPTVERQILGDLERLTPEEQLLAAASVRKILDAAPRGVRGQDLLVFAGTLDPAAACEMKSAIETDCERIESNEW